MDYEAPLDYIQNKKLESKQIMLRLAVFWNLKGNLGGAAFRDSRS